MIRTYSELIILPTFEERLDYLRTNSKVGMDTFGYDRIFNQQFYSSTEWKRLRNQIIVRDNGCDLGVEGYEIPDGVSIYIHHMNPITLKDLQDNPMLALNPEYLITTTFETHNAIHYSTVTVLSQLPKERTAHDMCPWKR